MMMPRPDYVSATGHVTMYLGDAHVIVPQLPAASVDLIATDPPFNVVNRESAGLRSFDKGGADSEPIDIDPLAREFSRITTGSAYVFASTEQVSQWRRAFVANRMTTRQCVWEKTNPSPANAQHVWLSSVELAVYARKARATFHRFYESPVWRGPSERVQGHKTPKPVWLMTEIIDASTDVHDTVLDPFTGSGSTAIACIQTGRKFIGIEKNPDHFTLAVNRIEAALTARAAA